MRTRIRVGLAAVVLGLVGCTAGQKNVPSDAPQPFTGTALTRPARDASTPPPEVDNLLAGKVLDRAFSRPVSAASIQVVDLQDTNPAPAARLDVSANADGYFVIPGLQRGHHYQLIARVKDGDRLMSGVTLAMPPNPRLAIYLSEDYTSPRTPAPLDPPVPPTPPAKAPSADKEPGPTPAAPSASIESPGRTKPEAPWNPGGTATPPALNKIADNAGAESGGFQKVPPAPKVEIPYGPSNPVIPPPPPFAPTTPPRAAPPTEAAPPVDQASARTGPPIRTAPPFCVLVGNRLDNFALPTLDGQTTWEYRRDPPRKLVLLDFWKSNCAPCLAAIPHLCALQEKYGRDGLEVVGVACEDPGPAAQQEMAVRGARSRLHINYSVLMGADAGGVANPVRSQFLVDSFPRLFLIDESGAIVWHSDAQGLGRQSYKELEWWIDRQLHPTPK